MESIKMENKLTGKQEKFCVEYVKDFNATAAAKRSGYSAKMAYSTGWENTRKPEVKARIAQLLEEQSMQPDEIKKRLTDMGCGDLSDYIIIRTVTYTPKIKKGLQEVIDALKLDIAFEDSFAIEAALKDKELEAHEKGQQQRRRQLIRLKLELENNPNAYRIVNGPTELIEEPVLDVVAISRDKEKGKIKSFKQTKDGIQVELYPADAALTNLARVHSLFKDNVDLHLKGSVSRDKWLEDNSDGKA